MYAKSSGEDTPNIAGQKIPSLSKRPSRLALEHQEKIPSMMGLDTLPVTLYILLFVVNVGISGALPTTNQSLEEPYYR